MSDAIETHRKSNALLGDAIGKDAFAAIPDPESSDGRKILRRIADKIGKTRRPGSESSIPAGSTYLAQFVAHDLDLRAREDIAGAPRLDLALIYGDGPKHDAFAYQVPAGPGEARSLLRMGRARPADNSPAWGAARDLPRAACPHLDAKGVETKSEVLVPNTFSDSNLLLGQVQTLWALLHNAVMGRLAEARPEADDNFETARRITRHVYREAIIHDVLGTWMHEPLRKRYVRETPRPLASGALTRLPRTYMTGVARLGHGLVRDTYELNDHHRFEGLRSLIRHNSASRPSDMPLTEDWLIDFARFFDIEGRKAQRARGLGPHVARPFALGGGVGLDAPTPSDGLVLRDLIACTRVDPSTGSRMPNVRALVRRIEEAAPGLLDKCFAQDESRWTLAVAEWLADVKDVEPLVKAALAEDPPLTLFLMLEAEQDAGGATLGAIGSILLAETLAGALPPRVSDKELAFARSAVFRGAVPNRMAELIVFLQRHYQFAEGARLHPAEVDGPAPKSRRKPIQSLEATMLDNQTSGAAAAGLVEVADYIEFGRLVADWAISDEARPKCFDDLVRQLDGIAKVPPNITDFEFIQGEANVLMIRLPEKDLIEKRLKELETLLVGERYKLPKFYDDIYHRNFGPELAPLEIFLARMGDYTIARCQ